MGVRPEDTKPEKEVAPKGACWLNGSKDGVEAALELLSMNSMSRRLSEAAGAAGRGAATGAATGAGAGVFNSGRAAGAGAGAGAGAENRVGDGPEGALLDESSNVSRATFSTMLVPNRGTGRASSSKSNHTVNKHGKN